MNQALPHIIKNHLGEELIFHRLQQEGGEEKLIIEIFISPGGGSVMHTQYLQDKSLTVLKGKMGYQLIGEESRTAGTGETVLFQSGQAHRFWNAGDEELHCFGWIKPANNIVFCLTAFYNALNESGREKPEQFDGAYVLYRYQGEFDMAGLPLFVKKVVIPATYYIGKWTGRYRKFKAAPEPLSRNK